MSDTYSAGAPAVTVTHILLSRETYNELLSGLDELDENYGKTAETANARRWLHYRWLLAQSGQDGEAEAVDGGAPGEGE